MTLNVCEAGHLTHVSKLRNALYGPIHIWDWTQYQDQAGLYCPGQDEVSKSIDLQDVWERDDSAYFWKVLGEQAGLVLDFGSHIGWFSKLALMRKCQVLAVDADPENMRLFWHNVGSLGAELWIESHTNWVADLDVALFDFEHVRLFKSDLEGHEHEALNLTRHLWQQRKIDFGLWELSPIFEKREGIWADSYAALVDEIASYGYRWFIWKGSDRWYIEGKDLTFGQENGWCEKLP